MIEVDKLVKRFGSFTAVDHISFSVHRGEIFGFLGSQRGRKDYRHAHACAGLASPPTESGCDGRFRCTAHKLKK